MSVRKPFNTDRGYVCSLKTDFGWVVIYDREKGGDWIDADTRWVLAAYDKTQLNIALLEEYSLRQAREDMKATRDGDFRRSWIGQFQEPSTVDIPPYQGVKS